MSTQPPPAVALHLVVGYDGYAPAIRALDAAARILRARPGRIHVIYVASVPGMDTLSPDAIGEIVSNFNDIEHELRGSAAERLAGNVDGWEFERRQGMIAEQLIAAAKEIHDAHPDSIVVIMVGSSSNVMHRVIGSVAVSLARRSPMPLTIVP